MRQRPATLPMGGPRRAVQRLRTSLQPLGAPAVWLLELVGPALGSVFLIPAPWIGALLWLGIAQDPRHAAFALLGLAVALAVQRGLAVHDGIPLGGGIRPNALLAAVAAAWMTSAAGLSVPVQVAIAAAAATASAILAAALIRALSRTNLPSLVLAYCIVAGMLFVLFPDWTEQAVAAMAPWPMPEGPAGWIGSFLRSMGSLLFSSRAGVGLVVVVAILLWSRTAFICGVVGWLAGAVTGVVLVELGLYFYWLPAAYNFFIAGMGLGAVFFLPGRIGLVSAAAGGAGAALFAVLLQYLYPGSTFAYLPLSSALAIWVGIHALTLSGDRKRFRRRYSLVHRPEEDWWHATLTAARFGHREALLVVPVPGAVQVVQGFGGRYSHLGDLRHALDLQRPVAEGANTIFGAPVISPASGVVEQVRNDIADNPLGVSNYAENWGNHVIIRLDQGGWAVLAHFGTGTVAVRPGERVAIGTYLGTVGNSGRSPLPHLHLQVQGALALGSTTVPFRLANYVLAPDGPRPRAEWVAAGVPGEEAVLWGALPNRSVHDLLAGIAPGHAVWTVEMDGPVPALWQPRRGTLTTRVTTLLDEAGRHRFEDDGGAAMTVRMDPDAWRVVETDGGVGVLLRMLAHAVPAVPYAATVEMVWHDFVPVPALAGAGSWLGMSIAPYRPAGLTRVRCTCIAEPAEGSGALGIETRPESPAPDDPEWLECRFDTMRGPTHVQAGFANGATVAFTMMSFAPGEGPGRGFGNQP